MKTYMYNNCNPVNTSSKFYLTDDKYSIISFLLIYSLYVYYSYDVWQF